MTGQEGEALSWVAGLGDSSARRALPAFSGIKERPL